MLTPMGRISRRCCRWGSANSRRSRKCACYHLSKPNAGSEDPAGVHGVLMMGGALGGRYPTTALTGALGGIVAVFAMLKCTAV
jgi:predicted lipid-binding transport protein (Tim44 family)